MLRVKRVGPLVLRRQCLQTWDFLWTTFFVTSKTSQAFLGVTFCTLVKVPGTETANWVASPPLNKRTVEPPSACQTALGILRRFFSSQSMRLTEDRHQGRAQSFEVCPTVHTEAQTSGT